MSSGIVSSQNSSYISIVPSTQTEFTENSQMIIEIDETLGYIKGRDSYLCMDVTNTSSDNSRWSFPNGVGASALINRLEIYSKSTGQLLETLENYNQWCGIENQYMRDDYSVLQRTEGVGSPSYQYMNESIPNALPFRHLTNLNPASVENNLVSPINKDDATPAYTARRFCIPIKSGVFSRWWDEEKLCPVMNLGGLRMVFTFASNEEVCKRLGYYPQAIVDDEFMPNVQVYSLTGGPFNGIPLLPIDDEGDTVLTKVEDLEGTFANVSNTGLAVGNKVVIAKADDTEKQYATITGITYSPDTQGQVIINFEGNLNNETEPFLTLDTTTRPSYLVQNVELRVLQMIVPKDGMEKLAKPMKYEYTTYDQFHHTIPSTILRDQIPITSVASKAKAVFTHFVQSSNELDQTEKSYYSGMGPSELELNSIQLFVNNKLYPLQAINPQSVNDKSLMLNELVKAFRAIGKQPLNLGTNEFGGLNDYSNTFLYARELARGQFVYNLQNAEPEVRVGFSGIRENCRTNTYVFSKKIVDISAKGLAVML